MGGRPLGITVIAIILAVSGVFQLLVGSETLGWTNLGLGAVAEAAEVSGWASVISGVATIVVAGGLFTLAGWAWLLAVVVLGLRIVVEIALMLVPGLGSPNGSAALINALVSAVILWYFMRPGVKASFGR
ncbi:MAG: hypothetical protein OEV61_07840 [Chloroflexota bacterium]|nr:hypothetical protein [Chloroflexota bacterium]